MPAILSDSDAVSSWLNPQLHGFDALKVLRPVKTNEVSSIINSFVGFSILSLCRLGAFHLLECKNFYDSYRYVLQGRILWGGRGGSCHPNNFEIMGPATPIILIMSYITSMIAAPVLWTFSHDINRNLMIQSQ